VGQGEAFNWYILEEVDSEFFMSPPYEKLVTWQLAHELALEIR
jgi:hypothetical protein